MSNLFKFAENILNNLDQTTQSSIHGGTLSNKTPSGSDMPSLDESYDQQVFMQTTKAQKLKVNKQKAKTKDDELMDFLNNSTDISAPPQNDTDMSNLKSAFLATPKQLSDIESDHDIPNGENLARNSKIKFKIGTGEENLSELSDAAPSLSLNEKSLITENKRLKYEMNSLQGEIKSLLTRVKNAEEEFQRSKRKVDHFQNQISESDKIIRELRAREDDMNESLKSKDTQLAILRVRINEVDSELKSKTTELDHLKSESNRILRDHSNSSDIQSQAFETLKEKLATMELNLQREKDSYLNAQKEHMSTQNRLEQEKHELTNNLNLVEKRLNDEKSKVNDLTSQMKNVKQTNNNIKQELEEYKQKAAKILQSKDKLIASLKEGLNSGGGDGAEGASMPISNEITNSKINLNLIELEELKSERDYLKEELYSRNSAVDMLKAEIQELEGQTSQEIDNLKDQIRTLQDNVMEERQKKDSFELDVKNLRQELQYAQEELYKQKTNLNSRLQEREKEIEKLRNQLTAKNASTTTEKELEGRLHSLTESIIQKQTMLEALQSEKHSLFLQLERSEKRLQDYENIVTSRKTTILNLNDDDDTSSKPAQYFRESPYDHEVTRKVKRAATEIDKFSVRLGVFLKRYPAARVFVIIYMILLHLWVLIVLFTYKPEMHDSHPNNVVNSNQFALPDSPHRR